MSDIALLKKAFDEYNIRCLLNEPMCKHTSFKIGGAADLFVTPENVEQLAECVKLCTKNCVDFFVLGNGSNVVFTDKGYRGVVISTLSLCDEIKLVNDSSIKCSVGTRLSTLCSFALENSLSGIECLWGIPGTVGGAVYMNAGAYGGEISDSVIECTSIDTSGNLHTYPADELDFSYRHSRFSDSDEIIIDAVFRLKRADQKDISAKMDDLISRRKEKQPLEYPSAGSVFKRPEGYFAAALIEQCGLKGRSVGGCCVSHKHSGFIVNTSNATCADLISLIDQIKAEVYAAKSVSLECEIKIIGE